MILAWPPRSLEDRVLTHQAKKRETAKHDSSGPTNDLSRPFGNPEQSDSQHDHAEQHCDDADFQSPISAIRTESEQVLNEVHKELPGILQNL
jgi:hypothetical protein